MKYIGTLIVMLLAFASSAFAEIKTGSLGTNVKYELDTQTGVLHIYGKGDMTNYKGNVYSDANNPYITNRYYYPNAVSSPFKDKGNIQTVIIDEGVTSIGAALFYGCTGITSVSMPASLKLINFEAFRGCSSLESVTIPAGVTAIKERSFTDCGNFSYIYVDPKNTSFVSVDGVLYTADKRTLVRFPEALNKMNYVIPEGCVDSDVDALYKLKYVTSITIPTTMTAIRYGSFDNSQNLRELVFKSKTPPTFGKAELAGLNNLNTIYVPCGSENAYKNSRSWNGFKTKSVAGAVLVDFRVYSNDVELGDATISTHANCTTSEAQITAIATNYGQFSYWEDAKGNHYTDNPLKVKLPASSAESFVYTAYFEPKKYTITVQKGNNDSSTSYSQYQVSATNANDPTAMVKTTGSAASVSKQFKYGDVVSLYCEITPGKKFTNWNDGNLENPRTIVVTQNATYTAFVSDGNITIKTMPSDATYGSTTPASKEVKFGSSVEISATAKSGYQFLRWDDGDTNATRTVVATADKTYIAYYELKKYTVAVTVDSEEMGSVTGYGTFNAGTKVTLTATPNANYTFVEWSGTTTSTNKTLTINSLGKNYDLVAKFKPVQFTITYKNPDGTTIKTEKVDYNTMPTPADPVKESTAQYDYTFAGWTPELAVVTGDATYTARYNQTEREYDIIFKNEDGTQLQKTSVKYGVKPTYNGATPTKAATAQYTYTFKGWDKTIAAVTGNATYTATYDQTVNKYDITFVDEDGTTVLSQAKLAYGQTPTKPANPTKAADVQYTYTFSGWTPAVAAVKGDATYKATYSKTLRKYTVTFKDGDGKTLQSVQVDYGKVPAYSGATPTKATTAENSYTFNNTWSPTLSQVKGDAIYTAQFDATKRKYKVTFYGHDGTTVLQSSDVEYGKTPTYTGATPTKPASASTTYKFNGWSPAVAAVTGVASYTAQFIDGDAVLYTITFKNSDGTTLVEKQYKYNDMPSYNGTPTLAPTKDKVFTFNTWTPAIAKVTGNKTYTATYTNAPRPYMITFVDEDGVTELQKSEFNYGVVPTYSGAKPTKAETAEYTYEFNGWTPKLVAVAGASTYKATYTATKKKFAVTFVDYDNTVLKTQDVEYGANATAPATPTRTGYTFAGWQGTYTNITKPVTIKATYNINRYKITFKNYDGTVLDEQTVDYNTTPSYAGTPLRPATAQYTYTFKSWDKTIVPAVANAVYTATYSEKLNSYTVVFYNDDNKTVLQTLTVAYGTKPEYTKATPTKEATAEFTYTFSGWSPAIAAVTGDASYTAKYTSKTNEYEVSFVNWDGTLLANGKKNWKYGEIPYYGTTPTRPSTAQYEYVFTAWDPSRYPVDGPQVYTAQYEQVVRSYEIKFYDYDGTTLLYKDNFEYGKIPVYNGAEPKRASNGLVNYTFTGWTPDLVAVSGAKSYKAVYSTADIIYDIKFVDYNDEIIATKKVAAGKEIKYDVKPSREEDSKYTYTFKGWYPELTAGMKATGDMTFKAQYDATLREYNVRFEKDDHTEIVTTKVKYGSKPVEPSAPTKAKTDEFTYTFAGWDKAITEVTHDVTYTAVFTSKVNKYQVTFVDYDGKVLQAKEYEYGATPECVNPSREKDAQYTYKFDSWTPAVSKVTGAATYEATYTKTVNKYEVTFKNENGTVIVSDTYDYGEMPKCETVPTKASTKEYTYTFAGWDHELTTVTGNDVYVATFASKKNSYTIVFADENGKAIKTYTVEYGVEPKYDGATPTKAATAQYTYTFAGWQPKVVAVEDNAAYKATFSSTVNKYSVVFKNHDGVVLQSEELEYGTMPTYKKATPTKKGDAQYSYAFRDWSPAIETVKGEATYTAQFDETVNSYVIKFVNYDNSVLQETSFKYGETPVYNGETPKRPGDKVVNYTFKEWTPAIQNVTGAATYKATYTTADNVYTITFVDHDGTLLMTHGVESTEVIKCDITPTREPSVSKVYTFKGWKPELTEGMKPTDDMTFIAQYTETTRQYAIKFVMDDGSEISSEMVNYGVLPTAPTDVKKNETAQYSYTFKGWDKKVVKVAGDETYKAVFTPVLRSYKVTFLDFDGKELQSGNYNYGEVPSCKAPERAADAQYTYTFQGWDKQIVAVEKEETYVAEYTQVTNKYTVTFKNEDGTVLQTSEVEYDIKPEYLGATPSKATTDEYEYTFTGWDKDVVKVKEDAAYVATFSSTKRKYDIIFADEEGNPITTLNLEYGEMPKYGGETPVKTPTAQYTYTFEKWTPDVVKVTGNATYKAQFNSVVNEYKITFKNYDGSVVEENVWAYGSVPECSVIPVKAGDAQYTYSFTGWDREIAEVTGEATYTAQYAESVNKYKVTFVNYDNAILLQDYFEYGAVPKYSGSTPEHPSDGVNNYTFMGWSPDVVTVSEDATYTATYSTASVIYTMKFVDYDGTELLTSKFEANAPIVCTIVPTRQMTDGKTYEFKGWNPALTEGMKATKNMTFKAQYTEKARMYDIRFVMDNGDEIATVSTEYGKMPVAPSDVKKASDGKNSYVFEAWSPALAKVTGAATYTAQFKATPLKFKVEFVDYDGKVIASKEYEYGEMPTCDAPSRKADVQNSYTFAGWDKQIVAVTAEAKYTATYNSTVNSYTITTACNDAKLGNVTGGGIYAYGTKVTLTAKPDEKVTFVKWSDGVKTAERTVEVKGDATYTAEFELVKATYTVKFLNHDGKLLKEMKVQEGDVIATDLVPTREPSKTTEYVFNKWDPFLYEGYVCTGDVSFTAIYNEKARLYHVVFVMDDGITEISSGYYEYGVEPDVPTNFKKPSNPDKQVSYSFQGWEPKFGPVTADVTYVAKFEEIPLTFNVNFYSWDGYIIKSFSVPSGFMPYCEDAYRPSDASNSYEFIGWDKEIVPVVADADYHPKFKAVPLQCNVSAVSCNEKYGTVTGGGMYPVGATVTVVATPTSLGKFVGWSDDNKEASRTFVVNGDVRIVAMFEPLNGEFPEGVKPVDPEDPEPENPDGPDTPENPDGPDNPENPDGPDNPENPDGPCYLNAPATALYDWLLMVDNKAMRLKGYAVKEGDVTWYRIVDEQDNVCDKTIIANDEVVGLGFYYTSDHNLIGTGRYYAVVNVKGVLFRTKIFDFSKSNKAMILPNRATPGQRLQIKGIEGEATIEVYDIMGRLVNSVKTDGECTYEIEAERTAGVYVVRVKDANGSVLKYLVK
ncbi:MAG: leucine-rich repeat protein [Bacteroidales bacterium]|nr:leucine-rich repeat protein [Bacteroidales bacterium]